MDIKQSRPVLTVSQLNKQARLTIEERFQLIWVTGELSNFARPRSGHWYFTLKDTGAQVRCAMFANSNRRVQMQPADGQQVLVRGRVSLYEGRGDFQIIADQMEPAGEGVLRQAFDALKIKLADEGLFDRDRKQSIPDLPKHIAVVTSPTGAALQDVLAVWQRRFPILKVTVIPTAVQGPEAESQVLNALNAASKLAPDAILLTRGGGSLEDLWTFNLESVARAVASIQIPIVSAIGHEIDIAITDFVADLRAPTPSVAAELMVPDGQEMLQNIDGEFRHLNVLMASQLREHQLTLDKLNLRLVSPESYLQQAWMRLDDIASRLQRSAGQTLAGANNQLDNLGARLSNQSPSFALATAKEKLQRLKNGLDSGINRHLQSQTNSVAIMARMLDGMSPLHTLGRGYAFIRDNANALVTKTEYAKVGDSVTAQLQDGTIAATVTGITKQTNPLSQTDTDNV
ncbi:MAG: exodeoxyribonuclease VII large subunit [Pseudomonadales bacterium]|nr:exodeoxyribonuclease VII large subunit [Pseudomonadales bacterium]